MLETSELMASYIEHKGRRMGTEAWEAQDSVCFGRRGRKGTVGHDHHDHEKQGEGSYFCHRTKQGPSSTGDWPPLRRLK